MLATILALNQASPATWLTPAMGVAVAALVYVLLGLVRHWQRSRRGGSETEEMSWEDLLASLRHRRREREKAGLAPDEDVPPDELLKELLPTLPDGAFRGPAAAQPAQP